MKPFYEHAGIQIFHADNRELLPTLSGVDLIITSPPYNMGNSAGGGVAQYKPHYANGDMKKRGSSGSWKGCALHSGYGECSDNMPHAQYVAWQKEVLRLCWNCLSPAGAIFYNHKVRIFSGEAVTPLAYNPDLPVRQIIIWKRAGGINHSPTYYLPTSEWIVIFAKPDFRLKHKGAGAGGDVWDIVQACDNPHPAPFPLELPARIIRTARAMNVCDPFMGSGTTLVAAALAGLPAVGCDVSEKFCEMAARRIDAVFHRDGLFAPAQAMLELIA